jgi:hypothetical protein
MTFEEMVEKAFQSPNPVSELRSAAMQLFSQGNDKAAVLEKFEKVRQQLRQAGREREEDTLMDVMDFLVGWCSPHMKLPPDPQSPTPHPEGFKP